MKIFVIILAWFSLSASLVAQQCEPRVFAESINASRADSKVGYEEFVHEDLPIIRLYRNRQATTATSDSSEWDGAYTPGPSQNGSYWSAATHAGDSGSTSTATSFSHKGPCFDDESTAYSVTKVFHENDSRSGTYFVYGDPAYWLHAVATSENTSEQITTTYMKEADQTTIHIVEEELWSYSITWSTPPAQGQEDQFPENGNGETTAEYDREEDDFPVPVYREITSGELSNVSTTTLTITQNPPPIGGEATTTIELSDENTTEEFIECLRQKMPAYGGSWIIGSDTAFLELNESETATADQRPAQKFKYRYRLKGTETEQQYRVNWREAKLTGGEVVTRQLQALVSGNGAETVTQEFEVDLPEASQQVRIFGAVAVVEAGCTTCGTPQDPRGLVPSDLSSIPGNASFENHGVHVKIGLGYGYFGENAGEILVSSIEPSEKLRRAHCLQITSARGDVVVNRVNTEKGWKIVSINAPQVRISVTNETEHSFELKFRHPGDPNGPAFKTWKFLDAGAQGTPISDYQVTETDEGGEKVYRYQYQKAGGTERWTLIYPGSLRRDEFTSMSTASGNNVDTTEALTILNGTGLVVDQRAWHYRFEGTDGDYWREILVSDTAGVQGEEKTTIYEYHPGVFSDGNTAPKLKKITRSDGTWEWQNQYLYNDSRLSDSYSAAAHEVMDEAHPYKHRKVIRSYAPIEAADDGTTEPLEPRQVMVYLPDPRTAGNHLWLSGKGMVFTPQMRKERIYLTEDGASYLETIYHYDSAHRLLSINYPDGTLFTQNFESQQTNKVWRTRRGKALNGTVVDGIETEIKRGLLGYSEYKLTRDIVSGNLLSREIYGDPEIYGYKRPQRITYLDGSTMQVTYACCGPTAIIDRDKVLANFVPDAMRRIVQEIRLGVTTALTLDPLGRILKTTKTAVGKSQTLGEATYNTAGDLISEKNAFGGVSQYKDCIDGATGYFVKRATNTTTLAVRMEFYNRAGELVEVNGTGTAPVRFASGIETSETIPGHTDVYLKSYSTEIRLTASGGTDEWVKTYFDAAGRPYKKLLAREIGEAIPAYRYFYKSNGQLEREVDPDGVARLFAYNGRGALEYTGVDMAVGGVKNGQLNLGGLDRAQRTVVTYGVHGTIPVRIAEGFVLLSDNSTVETRVRRAEHSADGLKEWHTIFNGANEVVTRVERTIANVAGERTVKTIYPDNSFLEDTYQKGRLISRTRRMPNGSQLLSLSFGYDELGRPKTVMDVRNGTTTYVLNDADALESVTTPVPGPGFSAQTTTYSYDGAGRLTGITEPDLTTRTFTYHPSDLLWTVSGGRTYPVEYTYDAQGRAATMTTHQNGTTAAVTTWTYNQYSGLLKTKAYAGETGPLYKYTPGGRLQERQWVRTVGGQRVKTTYAYNDAGDLWTTTYNDGTPGITQSYDRAGRLHLVQQDGALTLNYYDCGLLDTEVYAGGTAGSRTVTHGYNHALMLRTSLQMNGQAETVIGYGYDAASRLETVSSGAYSTTYTYHPNSALLNETISKKSGVTKLTVARGYDYINRLNHIGGTPTGANQQPWDFAYMYNNANQRTSMDLSDGSNWSYAYDSLGQVISGKRYWADDSEVSGQQFEYTFDSIGNRMSAKRGGGGSPSRESTYTPKPNNQYDRRSVPGYAELQGIAASPATVKVNGNSNGIERKGEYFRKELAVDNSQSALYVHVDVQVANGSLTSSTVSGDLFVPKNPENYTYDEDGNLKTDGRWSYSWDAENRLTKLENLNAPTGSARRLEFKYDWRGRRIFSKETDPETSQVIKERIAIYDGSNLYAELNSSGTLVQTYIWGLDMSGDVPGGGQSAGGVGGLIGVKPAAGPVHFAAYDGNGNVAGLVNGDDGLISAWYEYGPFGEPLRVSGAIAKANPIRWSSKYTDDTSQFVYYWYRCYDPVAGRWLSRDPIGEEAGLNLYCSMANRPLNSFDPVGLSDFNRTPAVVSSDGAVVYGPPNPEPIFNPGTPLSQRLNEKVKLWEETTCCENQAFLTVVYLAGDLGTGFAWSVENPAAAIQAQIEDFGKLGSGFGSGTFGGFVEDSSRLGSIFLAVYPLTKGCCRSPGILANTPEPSMAQAASAQTKLTLPKSINLANDLYPLKDNVIPKNGFTDVWVHSDGYSFIPVFASSSETWTAADLASYLSGRTSGDLRLLSCSAGKHGLAQEVANRLNVNVFAATSDVEISPVFRLNPKAVPGGRWKLYKPKSE